MVGAHSQNEQRPYSIASSPDQTANTGHLELLIAVEPNGGLGANLSPTTPGTLVDVTGPIGDFTLPETMNLYGILLVAGGTGIAPLRSMLDHLVRRGGPVQISLLYSARRSDEFAFINELKKLADSERIDLHQTVTRDEGGSWAGGRGRIGRSHFEAVLHEPLATLCVVCGPEPLVHESVTTLRALGVPDEHIRTEGARVIDLRE